MKTVLVILFFVTPFFSSSQLKGPELIDLVFVDSLGNTVMPEISIVSFSIAKQLKQDTINGAKNHLDSLLTIETTDVKHNIHLGNYHISSYPFLDNIYILRLKHKECIMTVTLITDGYSTSDTIELRSGNFLHISEMMDVVNPFIRENEFREIELIQVQSKFETIEGIFDSKQFRDLKDEKLLEKIILVNSIPPKYLIYEFIPIGIISRNQITKKFQVCYFSDDFIGILRDNLFR